VAGKYIKRVDMYKHNMDYIVVGIEVVEQEVEMWHVEREVEHVDWAARMPRPCHVHQGGDARYWS
jgi:hypothetical protein